MSNNFENDDDEFSVSSSDSDNISDNDDDNDNKLKIDDVDDVNDDDLNNSDSDEEKEEEKKEDEEDDDYYDEAAGVDEYEEPEVGDDENPKNIMPNAVSNKKVNKPDIGFSLNNFNNNDDDDDDDDDDENYLQKFDRDIKKNYINEFHPECIIHNFDEVVALSHVSKDKDGIIIDDLHKTIPFLTKYERARILGQRAKQIECGAKPFIKVPENIVDSYIIADLELKQKKIPFIIRRPIPGGGCEYWNLKDLEMILF